MRILIVMRFLITGSVFLLAVLASVLLWRHYMYSPWTRDGRVQANVIIIAPDVSGLVADVPVHDNQLVTKGDPLLVIDSERYRLALAQAQALVAARAAQFERLRDQARRRAAVGTDVVSREGHEMADSDARAAQADLLEAEARRDIARLNLERTQVRSPVDGHVTNLTVFPGDYATAGQPRLAVIDADSFRICGYFEETKLPDIHPGDQVSIAMLDDSPPFTGTVESIARGIAERENPTGKQLLAEVNPSYNWVRLAQRIPVRIKINGTPPSQLSMGMTCTVTIQK